MSHVIYGLHTGQAKKQITYREAKSIEMLFGTSFPDEAHACSQFFQDGITKFWIEEVVNKAGKRYWLYVKVNMAKAIGIGEYCIMPYTVPNAKRMIKSISKVLKKLKLDDRNADFGEWVWERFDNAFDVEVDYPELYMTLLDKSLDVNAYKKQCKRKPFTPTNPSVCESIRFGNSSYVYNVYNKLAELKNKNIVITSEILNEVGNIIRIERQNHLSAIKQLLSNRLVKELTNKKVQNAILKVLITDIAAFWGKGDYYSWAQVLEEVRDVLELSELKPAMTAFTKKTLEAEYDLYTKEVKIIFEAYGIMPSGICKEDVYKYQVNKIKGLYNVVTECYTVTEKRAYHVFPVPHLCNDGRYKAGITRHMVNETRRMPMSITGKTIEEYEQNVWKVLKQAYGTNMKFHCQNNMSIPDLLIKSADDILRFYEVVESKSVKDLIRDYDKMTHLKNERKLWEEYSYGKQQ